MALILLMLAPSCRLQDHSIPLPSSRGPSGWEPLFPSPSGGGQGGGCACQGEYEREHPKHTANDRSHSSDSGFQVDGGQTDVAGGHQSCEPERGCACSASLA